ncbi:MAG: transcriptional repressor [Candidatus Lokiarchaeota archaeon]|nr:transcriptional repressor [Candidatus Lokiarchaeota archaeon]
MDRDSLRAIFKKRGLKITPQRLAVFDAVIKSDNHPCAEDIFNIVSKIHSNISMSTVYQILHLLEELNMITPIEVDGTQRFEIKSNFHIHAICPICGDIEDLYSKKIKKFWELTTSEFDIKPIKQDIRLFRYCNNCK